ncbi:MAG: polysaccharide biosynthesis protein [Prevotella sp.]|nr:polysaccharide biosynthesis protein [Prevotella sp.]
MSIYTDKMLLVIGGEEIVNAFFVEKILNEGAREVRILGESETELQSLRESLNVELGTLNQKLRFYVGDRSDNAYLEEAMAGVDYVLYFPAVPRAFDCEVAPAENTVTFLNTVSGVVHSAIDCRVKKLVVVRTGLETCHLKPETSDMPALLAALMETVVVAEARYLGPDSATVICCARMEGNLRPETWNVKLIDYAFENAVNGDLLIQGNDGIERKPCENFEMRL